LLRALFFAISPLNNKKMTTTSICKAGEASLCNRNSDRGRGKAAKDILFYFILMMRVTH